MVQVVKGEVPEIVLVEKEGLNWIELFNLQNKFQTDKNEFVLYGKGKDKIYLNKEIEKLQEVRDLIGQIMRQRYLDKIENLLNQFEEIAGEKAGTTLLLLWDDWRHERQKAELKEKVDNMLRKARGKQIHRRARKNGEVARMAFDIGFGLYEEKSECKIQEGAEHAFMVGYLMAVENMEKQKNK